MRKFYLLILNSLFFTLSGISQTTVPFTTAGATTWYCPAGVTSITIECWGGGGGGGAATGNPAAGGGGAGGSYTKAINFAVTPGTTYNLFIGAGGVVSATTAGGSGGSSWFNSNTTLLAVGGTGGALASANSSTASGATAPTTGNIGGTTNFYGGNGGTGGASGASGGGGGGGAGTSSNGNAASGITGGTAVTGGGAGANGTATSGTGASATTIGGGGAGGRTNATTDRAGGSGFTGQVKITYTQLTYKSQINSINFGSATWCVGQTRSVTVSVTNVGTATWTDANPDINIGLKWDSDPDYGSAPGNIARQDAGNLAPGATRVYTFPIVTPVIASGTDHLNVDVVYEGISWFRDNNGGVGPGNPKVGNAQFLSSAITIVALPAAPTGTAAQSFCAINNPTVANLLPSGATIKWYASISGGAALVSTTPLVNGTHYYASQTNASGCESSGRFDVTATVNNPAAPTGSASQSFCAINNPTIANLAATGTTIKWYAAATSGAVLTTTTSLVNGTHYYASQTIGSCESATRLDVTAIVGNPSAPSGTSLQAFCAINNPTIADLIVSGTAIQWYAAATGGTVLTNTTLLVNGTHYYASQTVAGCESATKFDITITIGNPAAPTGTTSQVFCADANPTVVNLSATGTAIQWYTASTGGTLLSNTTALVNSTHYYASQTISGCESITRLDVTATVHTPVTITSQPTPTIQTICNSLAASFTVAASGDVASYQWYLGTNSLTDNSNINGSQTATLLIDQVSEADEGLYHVVVIGIAPCGNITSADAELIVNTNTVINTQPTPQILCVGNTATFNITATSPEVTLIYKWRKGIGTNPATYTDVIDGGNVSGAATATLSIADITAADAMNYYVEISDGSAGCPTVNSIRVALTVNATSVGGTVTADASVCFGTNSGTLTLGAHTGNIINWESSPDGTSWTTVAPTNTSNTQTYTNLTSTILYRAVVKSGVCPSDNSTFATITVNPNLVAGTIAASQTICYNTTPAAFTSAALPTGGTGSYTYQWQSSPNGTSWTNITGATATTYAPGALTATTHYRRNETSGTCGTVSSNVIIITVNPNLVAGTVAASQTICYNAASAALTNTALPAGGTGSYTYQWQSSPDNTTWTDISGATSTTYTPGILTATTYYRRNVTSGTCGTVSSNVITITVRANLVAGTVAASQTICYNTAPASFSSTVLPTGGTGSYTYQWQSSPDNTTWASITGATAATYTSGALTATTYFRRNETSGTCGTVSSNVITITVNPNLVAGTVAASQTICYNTTPAAFTSAALPAGGTGSYTYQWQSSPNGTSWTNITGATAATYAPGALTATTHYRRNETSGTCGTVSSNVIIITVNPNLVAGTVAASQTICYNAASAALTNTALPAGGTGSYTYQWQSSPDNTTWTDISGATSTTYTPGILTATTYYRRNVTSGTCGTVSSNVITITVRANLVAGMVAASQTICYNTAPASFSSTVLPTGGTGSYTYQWQSSPDNTTWASITGATAATYTSGALTATTYFRRNETSGTCGTVSSNVITITVNPLPTITSAATAVSKCFSSLVQTTTLAYSNPTNTPTTYSINYNAAANTAGFVDVVNATLPASPITINIGAGTVPGTYTGSITVKNANGCTSNPGINFTVTINALPTPSLSNNPASPICANTNVTYTTDAGQTNYVWTFSGTAGTNYIIVSGGNNTSNTAVVTWKTSGTKTVTVNYSNSNGCIASTPTSNTITVNALPTSSFTSTETSGTSNDNTICTGAAVTFTATSGYGSYIFKVNGTTVQNGTSNFYSTTTLTNGASITVDIANALNCGATFGPIIITVNPLPTTTLSANKTSVCPGGNVIFTAGGGLGYNFKVNGSSVQSGASNIYSSTTLNNNDAITVDVTNNNGCTGTSAPVVITVNALPSGTLNATATSICIGTNVTFTATAGFSNYNFSVNGTSVQNNGTNTFSSTALTNPSVVTVDVTNTFGCVATFNPVSVTVNALPTGTLTATETSGTANDNSICANAPVTFTATTGFSNYDFQVNNVSKQSGTSNTYISSLLADNDVVKVIVKNGSNCVATLNSITITVVASPTGTLTVSPSNIICAGDNIIFTANAGYNNYNFKINGTTVQNGTGNTYTTIGLVNGDVVTVAVTNTNTCTTTFNAITMVVNPLPTGTLVAVENSGNTTNDAIICTGATVVFTAPNGFTNYNFLLNNISVQNGTLQTYTSTSLTNGDNVTAAVTNSGGCIGLLNTLTITVNTLPVVSPITGTLSSCINSTSSLADATAGGTWSSGNTSVATVDPLTGLVIGVAAGTATINYTFTNANGCSTTVSAIFTVNAPPTVLPITGNLNVCTGSSAQLSNATSGGTWSSSNPSVATVDASGLVDGLTAGTATISYIVTDGNGCTTTVTADVTVTTTPTVAPITTTAPSFDVCIGGNISLKDATTGGVWSSSNTTVATINSSGVVTGLTSGTTDINYTITTSCSQTVSAVQTIMVNTPPSANISYTGGPFCMTAGPVNVNQTGTSGGTYTYTGAGTLSLASDGTITPATSTGGTYTVTYTIAASGGCAVYTTTTQVIITTAPSATIVYNGPYCTTSSPINVTKTGTAGGTYTSSPVGLTIDAVTGTVTPASSTGGAYTVTYTITASGGCAQFTTTASVTITTAPSATITYAGGPSLCKSSAAVNVTRNGTSGGTYTAVPSGLAIDAATGVITPASSTAGSYTVTYSVAASGGCAVFTTTASVIINPLPTATISGTTSACQNGTSPNITFTGAGGTAPYIFTYKINAGGNLTVTSVGNVATVAVPTTTLGTYTYTLISVKDASSTACTQNQSGTAVVTVNAPTPVTTVTATPSNVCLGNTSNLLIQPSTSALLISENFEGTNTFSVVNTGTNTAASAWINRTSIYTYNYNCSFFGCSQALFNSGSKFMLANSDDGGGATNTALVSPTVNTSGYSALTLSYKTYFRKNSSEVAIVEVSTNNGTSWTAVQTLTSTTGAAATFSTQVLNLNTYVNNSSLIIRFRYTGNNEWWWAVDDVQLLATSSGYNYSWTATPAATAGLPLGAATPAAANANIAVKPTASGSYVYTATLTNAAGCTSTKTVNVTVSALPTVSITADYCAVAGKVRLTANGTSGVSYVWSTGETTQSIDVDVAGNYDVTVAIGAGCPITATISVANELVVNGDFTNGNIGFTSDYAYKPDIAGNNELVDDSGNNGYSVSTNGQNVHYDFWGKDHTNNTSGVRNFMLVNGHGNTLVIWKQTVSVLPNTTYYFSGWAMSLNSAGNYAQLRFSVNGTPVGTTAVLSAHGESTGAADNWVRFYGTWTSGPTTTSADIYINDLQAALGGNDFGLDDISFGTLSTFVNLESAPGTDAQTPCINTAITPIQYSVGSSASAPTVTGLPPGVTSSFNGVLLTISGTPTVSGNYTYTVTTTGSCQPSTATGIINVQAQKITLSSGNASPSICVSTPVNIGFALSGTATGATIAGLPAGVSGTVSGTTYTISGTPTVAGSYPYTVTTSGACAPVTFTGTITVQSQTITLNSGNVPQTVCINTPISNIQYTISGTGTGATITGLPAGVTYSYNSGILFITGTPGVSGTFNYTINTTGSCASVSASGTITVSPNASLNLTSAAGTDAQTSCINTAITNITYAVNNSTSASVSGLPAGVTGSFSAGVVTISGTPTAGGTFNYTVTTSGGCGTGTATGTITVQAQTITLTIGTASPTLCVNVVMPNIVYTIGGTASGATVTGLPAGLGYSVSANTITISGTPTTSVGSPFTYTVTLSGTCTTVTSTGTITVSPAATGGTVASVSTCSGGSGSLTLTSQAGTIVRWESSLDGITWTPITNTTISQTFTNVTVPTKYRVVVGNSCGNVFSSVATVGIHNLWTGGTSSDWNTASNWSDGQLPTATPCPTVTIPVVTAPNVYPVLSSGTAAINNLVITANASLIVTGATLQIAGTVSNSGIFDVSNGTIEMTGAVAQTIAAGTFQGNNVKNLIISNMSASGVTLGGKLDLYGALSFGSNSNQKLTSAGYLNLRSTAVGTARVADVTNGGVNTGNIINGDVVVERYYPGRRAWRLVTAPVSTTRTIFNEWQIGGMPATAYPGSGTYITSPTGGNGLEVSRNFSLKTFDKITGQLVNVNNTNVPISSNLKQFNVPDNIGYFMFIRGDRTPTLLNPYPITNYNITTLRDTGVLQTGKKTFGPVAAGGFMLVGNPYASPVDFGNLTLTNVLRKFWAWDPRLNSNLGAYVLVDGQSGPGYIITPAPDPIVGATGQDQHIHSTQAIFVQASSGGPGTVEFNETSKSAVNNNTVFRPQAPAAAAETYESLRANLYLQEADTAILADGVYEQFSNSFSDNIDSLDALKFTNFLENLGIVKNGKTLTLERRPLVSVSDTIFFKLWNTTSRNYQFRFSSGLNHPGLEGYLEDSWLKTSTPVDLNGYTNIDFSVTADAASRATDRFRIVFKTTIITPLPVTFTSVKAYQQSSAINVEWKVENEINIRQYEVERSTDGVSFTGIATVAATGNSSGSIGYLLPDENVTSGTFYYRIRSISNDGKAFYSNIVKVVIAARIPRIYVYPNPVIAGSDIGIHFINQPQGRYGIRLLNKLGQLIIIKKVEVSGVNSTQTLPFNKALAHGTYQLEISKPDGSKKSIAMIY